MRLSNYRYQCLFMAGLAILGLAATSQAQGQTLSASPSSLTFGNCVAGGGTLQQTLNLNTSSGTINFTTSVVVNQGSGWLSVDPGSGTAPRSVTVRVNTGVLTGGNFTGLLRYNYAGGQLGVNVTVNCTTTPPNLIGLDPTNVAPGTTFTMTVTGTNFQNGVVVFLNGQALSTTRDSANQVRAQIPGNLILQTGTYQITAQNPGSPVSNSLGFGVSGPSATLVTNAPPQGLSFNVPVNSTTTQSLSVSYAASNGSNREISAQAQSSGWLSVELSSGTTPGSAAVRVNPTGLAAGNYSGSVTFVSPTLINSPVVIAVSLTVTNVITLAANPAQVAFNVQPGSGAQTAQVGVSTGGNSLPFLASAQSTGGWLSVNPSSGSTPGNLTITATPGSLSAGTYNGSVQVTSVSASNSPLTIPVTLTIAGAAPNNLTVNPNQLSFTATQGQNPAAQSISVGATGSALNFTTSSNAAWLSAGAGTTPANVPVTVNSAGLAAGSYQGVLTITAAGAANSPQTVAVSLTVNPSQTTSLLVQPGAISLSAQTGGTASASVSVTSSGNVLSFSATAGANWISVQGGGQTPGTLNVTANAAGLNPGTHTSSITVSANGAANSPVTVSVTFTVSSATLPTLSASQSSVNFSLAQNAAPQSQTINLSSTGAAVSYTASVGPGTNWLGVSGSGSAPGPLTLTANPAGLAPGSYSATVTITAPGAANSPLAIAVSLTVTGGGLPTLTVTPQALAIAAALGAGAVSQNLTFSSGGAAITFAVAAAGASWLTLSAPGGTTPATITVTANPAGLAAGIYNATVTATSQGAANPNVSIAVTFTVTAVPTRPTLSSVVNGASFADFIAPNMWITIRGTNLSPVTREIRADEFIAGRRPTQAEGVSVEINNRPAYLHYLSPGQLNVVSPDDPATGPVNVTVTVNGQTSTSFLANLQRAAPAFFLWPENQVVATSVDFQLRVRDGTFAGATTTAAKPGEIIILWGTGFGLVNPPVPAGQVATGTSLIAGTVRVTVGGQEAEYFGGALAPGFTALYQLAIRIPLTAADGELTVVATVDGFASPSTAVISVRR